MADRNEIKKLSSIKKPNSWNDDERHIKKLYEAYQLDWMISHGYSLCDVIKGMDNIPQCHDRNICNYYPDGSEKNAQKGIRANIESIFEAWEILKGFPGSAIYCCFDEFCDNELLDISYIIPLIKTIGRIDSVEYLNWYSRYITRKVGKGEML